MVITSIGGGIGYMAVIFSRHDVMSLIVKYKNKVDVRKKLFQIKMKSKLLICFLSLLSKWATISFSVTLLAIVINIISIIC